MKILITGATGLVGSKLLEELMEKGYDDIRVLTRDKQKAKLTIPFPVESFEWNPEKNFIEKNTFLDVDIVIHLAGDNIADGRWSEKKKARILNSRIEGTKLLINEIKKLQKPPQKIISSSAIGIYGSSLSDQEHTEESEFGNDFLATVCQAWEAEITNCQLPETKTHIIRTGIVLSKDGGALSKMLPAFQMGVAGVLGSGQQYMSWIHIDDLAHLIIYLIDHDCHQKIYNAVAPFPVTNAEFTKILGLHLKRPTFLPAPAIVLKTILGEMSDILLKGQNVKPVQLLKNGFQFQFPTLKEAFHNLITEDIILKKYLWINNQTPIVFHFFSDEKNLESITPQSLHFEVLQKSTDKIQTGTIIDYRLKIHGIPAKWKTEITSFIENKTFTDTQLKGPYHKWVHQHDFISCKNGTLMKDEVRYIIPMGIWGKLFAGHFIKKDVSNIFNYRNKTIAHFLNPTTK